MKKFQKCKLEELSTGDRFYFLGSKNKMVHEVILVWSTSNQVQVEIVGSGKVKSVGCHKEVVFLTSKAERESL
jgi:hypothetical protein